MNILYFVQQQATGEGWVTLKGFDGNEAKEAEALYKELCDKREIFPEDGRRRPHLRLTQLRVLYSTLDQDA